MLRAEVITIAALFVATAAIAADAPAPAAAASPAPATAAAGSPASVAAMKALGDERYQIGKIVVDRKAKSFTVPGRVIHINDAPLEYFAVGRAGGKAYESLLELDTVGSEFNVACILLGLDAADRRRPDFQFDRRPPEGPRVLVDVAWQADGKPVRKSAQQVLKFGAPPGVEAKLPPPPPEDWVYIGSFTIPERGTYASDVVGAIVGFVHDPASIIEHHAGLGIGAYGSVQGNPEILPPIGSEVTLIVTVPGTEGQKK